MKILFFLLGAAVVFTIIVIVITKIGNYFRGKRPVDYSYMTEYIGILLSFPSFKAFYSAAPENFVLEDEIVYFYEEKYTGKFYSHISNACIGFKTLKDLWDYQDWRKAINKKQREVRNNEATLVFCQKMSRILEEKKEIELKKVRREAEKTQSILETMAKIEKKPDDVMRPLPPTTDSILGR